MAQRGRPRKNVVTQQDVVETEQSAPQEEVQERPSASTKRSDRPGRVPINGYRDILSVGGQEAGFHYAWIRDDLTPRFEASGYEFVTHAVTVGDRKVNSASQIGTNVSIAGGNGRTLYLMRVLQEYYDEDMENYNAEIDSKETVMFAQLNSKEDGRYGKVQIKHGSKTR